MSIRISFGAVALAAALAACDRSVPTAGNEESASPTTQYSVERSAMDRLARKLARALADSAFRAYIKGELDRSPFPEHKLQLQKLLLQSNRRVLKEVARIGGSSEADVDTDVQEAIPLEIYFPVPQHGTSGTAAPICWWPAPGRIERRPWHIVSMAYERC